jgi:hypothetical protein
VARAAEEVLKDALIHERKRVRQSEIETMLGERQRIGERLTRKA